MNTLLLLALLFYSSFGMEEFKHPYLKLIAELDDVSRTALSYKDMESRESLRFLHFLQERGRISNLTGMRPDDPCYRHNTDSAIFTRFLYKMKTTMEPLNLWITETNNRMAKIMSNLESMEHARKFLKARCDRQYCGLVLRFLDAKLQNVRNILGEGCGAKEQGMLGYGDIYSNGIDQGSGELKCDTGNTDGFRCGTGECIGLNSTCDGVTDCLDGSDEIGSCQSNKGCVGCEDVCVPTPNGGKCVPNCPQGFEYTYKMCDHHNNCYVLCYRNTPYRPVPAACLVKTLPFIMDLISVKTIEIKADTAIDYIRIINKTLECRANRSGDSGTWQTTTEPTISYPTRRNTWPPTHRTTTRHTTWHPTHHTTWHPTHHTTWHPTHHTTWHPTHHTTWHPTHRTTTRHTTWHPTHHTTKHTTWHPTWETTTKPYWSGHHTTRHHHTTTPHSTTTHHHHTTRHTTHHTTTNTPPTTTTPTTTTTTERTTELPFLKWSNDDYFDYSY